jgi:hypothetical protein
MNPRAMQPKSETEVFEDTAEQYVRRGGMAPRDVMPEDLAPPKRMRMPPKEVKSKVPVKKMMGGNVKSYAKGGKIDGCAQRGKTKGRYI